MSWRQYRDLVPARLRRYIGRKQLRPVIGSAFTDLRRLQPISRDWGFDRGQSIDRYYIEKFLRAHASDIRGRVLEIQDSYYADKFGQGQVDRDVLDIDAANPRATIVGDLARTEQLPEAAFDCFILTQTLLLVYELPAAVRSVHHVLKPGGVALVTVPGISKICREEMQRSGDYWRFTNLSLRKLFEHEFPAANLEVVTYGNVLAAIGFLHGLAAEELDAEELDYLDNDYELVIALRAVKPPK